MKTSFLYLNGWSFRPPLVETTLFVEHVIILRYYLETYKPCAVKETTPISNVNDPSCSLRPRLLSPDPIYHLLDPYGTIPKIGPSLPLPFRSSSLRYITVYRPQM